MKLTGYTREKIIDDIIKASKSVNQQVNQLRRWREKEKAEAGRSDPLSIETLNMSQLTKQLKHYYQDQIDPKGADGVPKMKNTLYKDKYGDIKISTKKSDIEALSNDDLENLHARILGNKMKEEDNGWIGLANYKTATRMGIQRAENASYGTWVFNRSEKAQKEYETLKELHEKQPQEYPNEPKVIKPAKVTKAQMDTFWNLFDQHRNNLKDKDAKEQFYKLFDSYRTSNEFGDDIYNLDPIMLEQIFTKAEMFDLMPTDTLDEITEWYSKL